MKSAGEPCSVQIAGWLARRDEDEGRVAAPGKRWVRRHSGETSEPPDETDDQQQQPEELHRRHRPLHPCAMLPTLTTRPDE
jgi:hypothetical protein